MIRTSQLQALTKPPISISITNFGIQMITYLHNAAHAAKDWCKWYYRHPIVTNPAKISKDEKHSIPQTAWYIIFIIQAVWWNGRSYHKAHLNKTLPAVFSLAWCRIYYHGRWNCRRSFRQSRVHALSTNEKCRRVSLLWYVEVRGLVQSHTLLPRCMILKVLEPKNWNRRSDRAAGS